MGFFHRGLAVLLMLACCISITACSAAPEETVVTEPLSLQETVPETVPQTIPETTEETQPEPTEETVPETIAETVPEETEPIPAHPLEKVPLYFQTDYPDVMYGSGTIKSSGCSIVSLAMVASYLTGHNYRPEDLADWFGGYNGNNVERMEYASDELRLPWRRAENWHDARDAIQKGAVVIVMEDYRSLFTDSQHFIVVTGLTEKGRVLVNDSYEPNYNKWNMKEGFANGFTQEQICYGYSGAWIYDTNAVPDRPFIYEPEEEPYVEPRYPEFYLTAADVELMARVVWAEARGESDKGQQAVAEVILNRLAMEKYPDTVRDVVYAVNQFRSVPFLEDAEPTQTQYEAVERAIRGPYILPMDVTYFARSAYNRSVWGIIGGHIFCFEEQGPEGA